MRLRRHAGVPSSLLAQLWEEGWLSNVRWIHSYTAGVDGIAGFLREQIAEGHVRVSNGRSAFSSSLAEHAISAALHFTKQARLGSFLICSGCVCSLSWITAAVPVLLAAPSLAS